MNPGNRISPILMRVRTTLLLVLLSVGSISQIRFDENLGQWSNRVLYRADIPSGRLYVEPDGLLFVLADPITHIPSQVDRKDSLFRKQHFRISFLGSQPKVEATGEKPFPGYSNYFIGNDSSKWKSGVQSYLYLHIKDLYPNIDFFIYGGSSLKTEFLLKPGAQSEMIQMLIEGNVETSIEEGDLWIRSAINDIIELAPIAYQFTEGDTTIIDCRFILDGNLLKYQVADYDRDDVLIIDPYLVFSTYSGSTADNWGFTASFDSDGNAFSGGIVAGDGYPVSQGAFDINFQVGGNWDIGIIKYDSLGQERLWASYLGGSDCEMPHSLIADSEDNLLIMGTTGSSDFPTHFNAYDPTFNGGTPVNYLNINFVQGTDIFVFKLSANGSNMLGSTFIGGSMNDGINYRSSYAPFSYTGNGALYYNYGDGARGEIVVDANDQVYVGSCTFSDDFPVQSSFQNSSNGLQEGIVFCLNSTLSQLEWSSYIGGSDDDAVYSLDIDADGNVYFAGGTASSDLVQTTSLFPNSALGGTTDGFVGKIQSGGQNLLHLTKYGSVEYDQIYFVKVDQAGGIFIAGQTEAPDSTLILNASYNNPNSGQFIAKILPNFLSMEWSTVFGLGDGTPDIALTAFAVDLFDKIYLSGWGRLGLQNTTASWASFEGIKNMDVTPGAYQTESDGQDFYLMILSDDGNCLKYASFFGEQHYPACGSSGRDHVDGGTSRFDKRGYIYQSVCSSCGGCQEFPTYPSGLVWSESNNSSNCNNALFKFEMESVAYLPDIHLCNDESIELGPELIDSETSYVWSPAGFVSNPNSPNPFTQNINSDITLTLYLYRGMCLDSVLQRVYYHEINQQINVSDTIYQCYYDSTLVQVYAYPNNYSHWFSYSSNYNELLAFPDTQIWASPNTPGYLYILSFDDHCELEDSIYFDVPLFSSPMESVLNPCNLDSIFIGPTQLVANVSYQWEPAHLVSDPNIANPIIALNSSQVFTLIMQSQFCTDTLELEVNPYFLEYELPDSALMCDNESLTIEAELILGSANESWFSDAGFTQLIASQTLSIIVNPSFSQYFYFLSENPFCLVIDSVFVELIEVSINAPEEMIICFGDTLIANFVEIHPGQDIQYEWWPTDMILSGQGFPNPVLLINQPGFVYIESSQGPCIDKDSIYFDFSELSLNQNDLIITESGSIYFNQSILLEAYGPGTVQYYWSPIDYLDASVGATVIANPPFDYWYFVSAEDEYGCIKTDSIKIIVKEVYCDAIHVYVPSGFSPNGDNRNDVLFVRTEMSQDIYFAVFNRWGEKIFETRDASIGWDGYFKGELQSPGVFVYYLNATCWDGSVFEKKGNVTLLR